MYDLTCKICEKPFQANVRIALTCGRECRKALARKRFVEQTGALDLPSGTVGAMHEMEVCIDLLRKGFSVYRSVSQNAPFDIVAYRGAVCLRVEVTTGHKLGTCDFLRHPKKDRAKFDILAVVQHSGEITYEPPVDGAQT